jgi:Pyruvate/2-oxoacid:ferredoxin oxidoreductase delta subunit
MKSTDLKPKQFTTLVGFPRFLLPWLDRFYEPGEIDLVLHLTGRGATVAEVAGKTGRSASVTRGLLHRAFKRGVVNRSGKSRYEPADFHARYEIWALFEGWQDVPEDIRKRLNEWEMTFYARNHRRDIEALKKSRRDFSAVCPEYVLLNEAESLLEKVDHVYLWPCNCRAMVDGCKKPLTTCLRFSNSRGLGWEISKSRAAKILNEADRSGLMHSAEIGLSAEGGIEGAICNCCADCCFPHQLAEKQNARKLWPLTRYIARRLKEKCTACGLCARRCPFGAFRTRKGPEGSKRRQIVFYRELCRGCGLCATGCPEDAIVMDPLNHRCSLWDRISA